MSVLHPNHIQSSQSLFTVVLLALYWSVVVDYVSCFPWWPSHSQVSIAASWLQGPIGYDWIPWVSVGQWSPWLLRPPNDSTWTIYHIYIYIIYTWEPVCTIFFPVWVLLVMDLSFFWFNCIAYLGVWSWGVGCVTFDSPENSDILRQPLKDVMIGYPNLATSGHKYSDICHKIW